MLPKYLNIEKEITDQDEYQPQAMARTDYKQPEAIDEEDYEGSDYVKSVAAANSTTSNNKEKMLDGAAELKWENGEKWKWSIVMI